MLISCTGLLRFVSGIVRDLLNHRILDLLQLLDQGMHCIQVQGEHIAPVLDDVPREGGLVRLWLHHAASVCDAGLASMCSSALGGIISRLPTLIVGNWPCATA